MDTKLKNPLISLIAAIGPNRELGKDNKLPWNIKKDLLHFKEITLGHPIIMGRKTYESIGRPLPGRINIVISHITPNPPISPNIPTPLWFHSLEEAIDYAKSQDQKEIFIIGGASVYEQAIIYADKLYLTLVEGKFDADVFFPEFSQFKKVVSIKEDSEENYRFKYLELVKN
jgi:dihydrofolate reductase